MMSHSAEVLRITDVHDAVLERATDQICNELLVYDNFTVYALAGNAHNEQIQELIQQIKGEARGLKQPVGWTRPFDERTLSAIDISGCEDHALQELLRNPAELTARIGALTFLRAGADMRAKEAEGIADCIIPPEGRTVQIYSPAGAAPTERLIGHAIKKGVEPIMTSANVSGRPEIVHDEEAVEFASDESRLLTVLINKNDAEKLPSPLGSYPVISVGVDRLHIVRPGCFDPQILQTALSEYTVELTEDHQAPNYPDNILGFSDLPADVQTLQGAEFRLGLLNYLGWT